MESALASDVHRCRSDLVPMTGLPFRRGETGRLDRNPGTRLAESDRHRPAVPKHTPGFFDRCRMEPRLPFSMPPDPVSLPAERLAGAIASRTLPNSRRATLVAERESRS